MKPVFEQVARTFAHAFAMAEMDSHPVIRPNLLKAATRAETDGLSDDSVAVNAKRLKERFQEQGWIGGDPNLAPQNSNVATDEFFLIRGDLWLEPDESFREESVVSRPELRRSAENALQHYYDQPENQGESSNPELEIATTTIETRLQNRNWTHLGLADENGRIWVNPSDVYRDISVHQEYSSLDTRDIEHIVARYLDSLNLTLPENSVFNLSPLIKKVTNELREREWTQVIVPDVEGEQLELQAELHEKQSEVRERLSDLDNQYREYFENPSYDDETGKIEQRRRETFGFYKRNVRQLVEHDFFESIDDLDTKLHLYEYRVEAAETWRTLAEAEPETGRWNPGANDWRVEEEQTRPERN